MVFAIAHLPFWVVAKGQVLLYSGGRRNSTEIRTVSRETGKKEDGAVSRETAPSFQENRHGLRVRRTSTWE